MNDQFKLELFPEQLDIIMLALAFSMSEYPPGKYRVEFQAVSDYLKPIQKMQNDWKNNYKR